MKSFSQILPPRRFCTLALLAALAVGGAGPAMAETGPVESFNRAFSESAQKSATEACLKNGKESAKGKVSDELVAEYCDCSVKASLQAISAADAVKSYLAGQMSVELKAKLQELALACAKETFPPRSATSQ